MTSRFAILLLLLGLICAGDPSAAQGPKASGSVGRLPAEGRASAKFLAPRSLAARLQHRSLAELLLRARLQHNAMRRAQPADASPQNTWTSIYPTPLQTDTYGAISGRITSIALDPDDATGNTVYVGSTGGGVWKSSNAAGAAASVRFQPLTDSVAGYSGSPFPVTNSLSIGAVSVQARSTGVILAGTGDPNDALDSYYGMGVLRSTDGGYNWGSIHLTALGVQNFSFLGLSFAGFAWSTVSPDLVVAAVTRSPQAERVNAPDFNSSVAGIFYSQDAGANWRLATITDGANQVIQSQTVRPPYGGVPATSVAWNPVRQRFYAALRYHGYYESADGVTWTRLASQPGVHLDAHTCPLLASQACPIYRGVVAVQPLTGDTFALTVDINNTSQGLWQDQCMASAGTCTAPVLFGTEIPANELLSSDGNGLIAQGNYNLALAAVPANADTLLFAGTMDIFRCSLAAGCTWRNTTNVDSCSAARVAPSQHAMAYASSLTGLMYFGNDGGLWRSADFVGQAQQVCTEDDAAHFQNLNGGLGSLAQVSDLAVDPTASTTLLAAFGAQGTGSVTGATAMWRQVLSGEGSAVAIDPAHPQNWFATSGPGVSINLCDQGNACDAAGFGIPAISDLQVAGDGANLGANAAWALDFGNTGRMLVGTCRLWRGAADGTAWNAGSAISSMLDGDAEPFCNGNAQVRSLASSGVIAGSAGLERVYAGMAGALDGGGTVPGHLFGATLSGDAGASTVWTDLAASPVSNDASSSARFNAAGFAISRVLVDAHDRSGGTVYATVQGFSNNGLTTPAIYRSIDGGAHWAQIAKGLPGAPANDVAVDPNDANTVYVALDTGVYVTRSVAQCEVQACWAILGLGLPDAPVTRLQTFASGGKFLLLAATYGRGVWQIPLAAAPPATSAVAQPVSLDFGSAQLQTVSTPKSLNITNSGSAPLLIYGVSVSGDFAQTHSCTQIAAGDTCSLSITFLPAALGARTGALTLFANISGGQISVPLSGKGVPGADIVLTPPAVHFGLATIGTTSAAQNVTVSNLGGIAVGLASVTVSGAFRLTANFCGSSLAPATGCTVSVAFAPSASGAVSGALTVTDDLGTQTALMDGTGQAAATGTLAPLNLAFPDTSIGSQSAAQMVTLTNEGDAPLLSLRSSIAGPFAMADGCGTALAGHTSCQIAVRYVPANIGAETGTLTVIDALSTHAVALNGTGLASSGGLVSPTSLKFGFVGVSTTSPALALVLHNPGAQDLTQLSIATAPPFSIAGTTCGPALATGSSCTIQVAFSPAQAGPAGGALSISSPDLEKSIAVALSGTGVDFQLTVTGSSTAIVTSGQSASYQLQLAPVSGSAGTVTFACSGLPAHSTCSLNPTSLQMASGVTGSITVTVATGVSTSAATAAGLAGLAMALCFMPLGLVGCRRRALSAWVAGTLLLAAIGCSAGSSGGSSGGGGGGGTSHDTPSGNYTITVTGTAAGLARSTTFTLSVE